MSPENTARFFLNCRLKQNILNNKSILLLQTFEKLFDAFITNNNNFSINTMMQFITI